MYFEIDETHPDITPVGSVMSWREGVLLSIIVHLLFVIGAITAPDWLATLHLDAVRPQPVAQKTDNQKTQFVFVQPKLDLKALKPPERAEASGPVPWPWRSPPEGVGFSSTSRAPSRPRGRSG